MACNRDLFSSVLVGRVFFFQAEDGIRDKLVDWSSDVCSSDLILLKISGEVLAGEQSFGIDSRMIDYIASEIAEVAAMGVEVAVVIGGGNIFRGLDAADGGMEIGRASCRERV